MQWSMDAIFFFSLLDYLTDSMSQLWYLKEAKKEYKSK